MFETPLHEVRYKWHRSQVPTDENKTSQIYCKVNVCFMNLGTIIDFSVTRFLQGNESSLLQNYICGNARAPAST